MNGLYKLSDICDVRDGTHDSPKYVSHGYPLVTSKNIVDGKLDLSNINYLSEADYNKINERSKVDSGDIIMPMIGTIGNPLLVGDYCSFAIKNVALVKFPNSYINNKYVWYYLKSNAFKKYVASKNRGGTQKFLSLGDIRNIYIPVLTTNEQLDAVEKLDKVVRVLNYKNQELEKLDELIKARFVEMFGDPVHNAKNWETDTVENLCKEIYGGGTPSKSHREYYDNGDIPWVSSKDMKSDVISDSQIHITQLGIDNSTAKLVPVNSVIMVIRSGILKHTLPVAINSVPVTVNQDLKVFIPGERMLTRFFAMQFKMHEKDILSGVRAVTADNIEFNSLKQRHMIVPPIELQQRYVNALEQVDKSKVAVQKSMDKTQLLFDSLMQQYFG